MSWKPLGISNTTEDTPPLVLQHKFTSTGYIISISDFSYIWQEHLDRRGIIHRALNENTSIDPSEDASQLKILLQKIQDALDGGAKSSIQLLSAKGEDLVLQTRSNLPAPLHSLVWHVQLHRLAPENTGLELSLPLVQRVHQLNLQQDELIRHLHEKDHVITKLLDKLESIGADVTDVFPGAAGVKSSRKTGIRDAAAQYVKGLGKFDHKQWEKEVAEAGEVDSNETAVLSVFSKPLQSGPHSTRSTSYTGWYRSLKESEDSTDGAKTTSKRSDESEIGKDLAESPIPDVGEDEDEFQVCLIHDIVLQTS